MERDSVTVSFMKRCGKKFTYMYMRQLKPDIQRLPTQELLCPPSLLRFRSVDETVLSLITQYRLIIFLRTAERTLTCFAKRNSKRTMLQAARLLLELNLHIKTCLRSETNNEHSQDSE